MNGGFVSIWILYSSFLDRAAVILQTILKGFKFSEFLTGGMLWSLYDRLDVYIYDYFMKRKLHASAKAFLAEGKVCSDPVGKNM